MLSLLEPMPEATEVPASVAAQTTQRPKTTSIPLLAGEVAFEEPHIYRVLMLTNVRTAPDGALQDRIALDSKVTALSSYTTPDGREWIHIQPGARNQEGYVQAELLKQIRPLVVQAVTEESVLAKYPILSRDPIGDIKRAIPFTYAEEELASYTTLRPGDKSQAVERLRTRLYELGFYRKENPGQLYTDSTAEVIASFQRICGVDPTGIADPLTQALLFDPRIVAIAEDNAPKQVHYLDYRQQPLYIQNVLV